MLRHPTLLTRCLTVKAASRLGGMQEAAAWAGRGRPRGVQPHCFVVSWSQFIENAPPVSWSGTAGMEMCEGDENKWGGEWGVASGECGERRMVGVQVQLAHANSAACALPSRPISSCVTPPSLRLISNSHAHDWAMIWPRLGHDLASPLLHCFLALTSCPVLSGPILLFYSFVSRFRTRGPAARLRWRVFRDRSGVGRMAQAWQAHAHACAITLTVAQAGYDSSPSTPMLCCVLWHSQLTY